jgi:hypothetical protein
MRPVLLCFALLFAFTIATQVTAQVNAQNPATAAPVPVKDEPHHRLVLENPYVRVWMFELAGHEGTLLHAHDLPYLVVALTAGDFVNVIPGKPDAHVTLDEGQLTYSKGGFAHVVRTDEGTPFHNVTIELLRPQGTPRNRCVKVIDGPFDCPVGAAGRPAVELPSFETDEVLVQAGGLPEGRFYNAGSSPEPRLFVVLADSTLTLEVAGSKAKKLQGGDTYWLPAGTSATVTDATPVKKGKDKEKQDDIKFSRFYILAFKDAAN